MRRPECKTCTKERKAASRGCTGAPEFRPLGTARIPFGGRVVDNRPVYGLPDLVLTSCAGTIPRDRDLAPLLDRWATRRTLGVHPSVEELERLDVRDARSWAIMESEFRRVEGVEQAAAYGRSEDRAKEAPHGAR